MTIRAGAATDRAAGAGAALGGHVPADGLLHPVMLGAVAVLILNDHLLKGAFPGLVTGKLSDVAGLLFFPALLVALAEAGVAIAGASWRFGARAVAVAVGLTAVGFALVKLTPAGAYLFGAALGQAQAIAGDIAGLLTGGSAPPAAVAVVVNDPWDLFALVALLPAALLGRRRAAALQEPAER